MNTAILISGSGSNMVALVEAMQSGLAQATPKLVLSNKSDAGGLAKAQAMGVPTQVLDHRGYQSRGAFETALHDLLTDHAIDLICLAGFMRILGAEFVGKWQGRMLNVHPSILPALRGLETHARALDEGWVHHGCTVHEVTPELDEGPIVGQGIVPVHPDDDPQTLARRVLAMEHRLYPQALARFVSGDRTILRLVDDSITAG